MLISYVSGPVGTTRRAPGSVAASVSGSLSACHTWSREARTLVRREHVGDVAGQLVLGRPLALARDDPGHDPLAQVGVGLAGHGGLLDRRVLEQGALDLARADLEAAALDQVGGTAADDADVAVRRARGEVAGLEPAPGHRLGGRVRPVEVLEEEVRPPHVDLADRLVVGGLDLVPVVIDEPDID